MLRAKESQRMAQDDADVKSVLAANRRFYDAFGNLDIAEMERVWENSDRVLCVHPGWRLLRGWEDVRKSWEGIFYNTSLMHFNITNAQVIIQGDCAWVSCVENITSVVDARATNFAVQATNIFIRDEGEWRIVHHHASG